MDARSYRTPSFLRVFGGQLLLVVLALAVSVWLFLVADAALTLVGLGFVALGIWSIARPLWTIATRVTLDDRGVHASTSLGRSWSSAWEDIDCVVVFEIPTFGAVRRLKIGSRTSGAIYVSDLIYGFDDLVARVTSHGPDTPCSPPGLLTRLLIGG